MNILLWRTHKDSSVSFYYKNQKEMYEAQMLFIEIGNSLLELADN